jgi:hypothetical protein
VAEGGGEGAPQAGGVGEVDEAGGASGWRARLDQAGYRLDQAGYRLDQAGYRLDQAGYRLDQAG